MGCSTLTVFCGRHKEYAALLLSLKFADAAQSVNHQHLDGRGEVAMLRDDQQCGAVPADGLPPECMPEVDTPVDFGAGRTNVLNAQPEPLRWASGRFRHPAVRLESGTQTPSARPGPSIFCLCAGIASRRIMAGRRKQADMQWKTT